MEVAEMVEVGPEAHLRICWHSLVGLTVRAHTRRRLEYMLVYVKLVEFSRVSMMLCLTAWPEEKVLGLSIDTVMTGLFGQRLILFKTHVCHDRFWRSPFSIMSPCRIDLTGLRPKMTSCFSSE